MKRMQVLALLLGLCVLTTAGPSTAQSIAEKRMQALALLVGLSVLSTADASTAQKAAEKSGTMPTRAQFKMERDEFLLTHR